MVDPGMRGSHTFFILISMSTEAAAGVDEEKETAASKAGISETKAQSVQESTIAATFEPLE
jgi:hypothetical protein